MTEGTLKALQAIRDAGRDRPGLRLLDVAYGPRAAELRAACVTHILGIRCTKSSVHAQWGNWRRLMLNNVGAFGTCIAEQDAEFQRKAMAALAEPVDMHEACFGMHNVP